MKISYSKIILGGIIASTFLMAGCQKKGSARGVTPQLAESGTTDLNDKNLNNEDKSNNDQPKKQLPQPDVKATSKLPEVGYSEEEIEVLVSGEEQPAPKKEEGLTNGQPCSKDTILKTVASMKLQIASASGLFAQPKVDIIQTLSTFVASCQILKNQFTIEKIESCNYKNSKGEEKVLKNTHFDAYCANVATRLELEKFKQVRLEVADDLAPLFLVESQSWNRYLVDGKVEHDHRRIIDFVNEKKVACTFWTEPAESVDVKGHSFTITGQQEAKAPDFKVVNFMLKLNGQNKDDNASTAQIKMSCAGLDAKNVDVKLVKKALGSLLAVKPAAASAAQQTPVMTDEQD
jgi:hypothetical protein